MGLGSLLCLAFRTPGRKQDTATGQGRRTRPDKTPVHISASRGEAAVMALARARTYQDEARMLPLLVKDMKHAERQAKRSKTPLRTDL